MGNKKDYKTKNQMFTIIGLTLPHHGILEDNTIYIFKIKTESTKTDSFLCPPCSNICLISFESWQPNIDKHFRKLVRLDIISMTDIFSFGYL